jgi:predicted nucleic acid-binding protein
VSFVLDGSVALTWCFEDEQTSHTMAVLSRLRAAEEAFVPAIWPLEIANVVLIGERRERIAPAQSERFITMLRTLLIYVEPLVISAIPIAILSIGRTHRLSAYDASYLALAQGLGLPLATLDERLKTAARALGVALLVP